MDRIKDDGVDAFALHSGTKIDIWGSITAGNNMQVANIVRMYGSFVMVNSLVFHFCHEFSNGCLISIKLLLRDL